MSFFPEYIPQLGFDPFQPSVVSAFACLFVHQNVLHLLGNMVFLAAVGPTVEAKTGAMRLFAAFIAGGLAGVGGHWLLAVSTGVGSPLIGASGAIAGVVGYSSVRFFSRKVPIAPRLNVSVAVVAVVWVALQALGAVVKIGEAGGSSYWAHLFGFLGGLLIALVMRAPHEERLEHGREVLDEMTSRSPAAGLAAANKHLAEHPNDLRAMWDRADALGNMDDKDGEMAAVVDLLRAAPAMERPEVLLRLSQCGGLGQIPSVERMKMADDTQIDRPLKEALLRSVVEERKDDPQRPHALLAMAQLDPDDADRWLTELNDLYGLHDAAQAARDLGMLQ